MRSLLIAILAIGCGSSSPGGGDGGGDDGGVSDGAPGDGETSSCPSGDWCMETSPVTGKRLNDVWAVPGGDVYAVGETGTILRRRGGTWTQMTSNTTANLLGVWAASATDIWACAEDGTVLRSDGSTWSVVTGTGITSEVKSIWGSGANDVWFAGVGAIYHFTGSWSTQGFAGQFYSITGSGPSDVWAGGANNGPVLRHYTGTWGSETHGLGNTTIFAVLAFATNDVWATSAVPGKETVHWNGATWTPHAATVGTALQKLWGASPTDIWGAGSTRVGHWTGSSWEITQPLGTSVALHAVTGSGSSIWVVGADALIATHRD